MKDGKMPMQLTGRDPMIAKMRSEEFSAAKQAVLLFYRGSSSRKKRRGKGEDGQQIFGMEDAVQGT